MFSVKCLIKLGKFVEPGKQYTVLVPIITRKMQQFRNDNIVTTFFIIIMHVHRRLEVGGGEYKLFINTIKFYFAICSNAVLQFN